MQTIDAGKLTAAAAGVEPPSGHLGLLFASLILDTGTDAAARPYAARTARNHRRESRLNKATSVAQVDRQYYLPSTLRCLATQVERTAFRSHTFGIQ